MRDQRLPDFDDVEAAARRVAGYAIGTPLLEHPFLNELVGGRVLLKAECLQRTGSFKFRGAYNRLTQIDRAATPGGVVACSSGNHAQGVAEAARLLALRAQIVMPRDAPAIKLQRTERSGAGLVLYDRASEDRDAIAHDLADRVGAAFVAPFDDPQVIAGQGTVGTEIVAQARAMEAEPEAVLVPCGGGGLSAGIGLAVGALCPRAQLYAVEPEGFDDTVRSLASGRRECNALQSGSICDALLVREPGELTFALNRSRLAGGLTVADREASEAVAFAFRELKLVLEPGGAVALATVLNRRVETKGRTVVVVLSGGNVDPQLFARLITGTDRSESDQT